MTRIALGGMREARVPPAATTPAASRGLYPFSSMCGIATRLNTAAVAVLAPETAAKPAVANTLATASPPGTHPTHARAALNRAWVSPAW